MNWKSINPAKPAPAIAIHKLTRFARNAATGAAVLCALMVAALAVSQPAHAQSNDVVGQLGLPLVCDKEAFRCTIVKTQCMTHWADGFTYEQWSRFSQDEISRRQSMCIARLMLGDKRKYEEWSKATDEGRLRNFVCQAPYCIEQSLAGFGWSKGDDGKMHHGDYAYDAQLHRLTYQVGSEWLIFNRNGELHDVNGYRIDYRDQKCHFDEPDATGSMKDYVLLPNGGWAATGSYIMPGDTVLYAVDKGFLIGGAFQEALPQPPQFSDDIAGICAALGPPPKSG
jgi:hypothetical protein